MTQNDSEERRKRKRENKWNGFAADFINKRKPHVELEKDPYVGMKWDRDFIEKIHKIN